LQKSLFTRFVTTIVIIIFTAYCAWTWFFQIGLYATLIRFQTNNLGVYFPIVTGMLIWGIPLFFLIIYGFSKHKNGDGEFNSSSTRRESKGGTRWLGILTLLFMGLSGSAYYLSLDAPDDHQQTITIDLKNFKDQSLWFKKVSLNGTPLNSSAINIKEHGKRATKFFTRYTPIAVSKTSDQAIRFIHSSNTDSKEVIDKARVSMVGFVVPTVLPVLVRDSFEADGIKLADRTYLIGDSVFSAQITLYIVTVILGLH